MEEQRNVYFPSHGGRNTGFGGDVNSAFHKYTSPRTMPSIVPGLEIGGAGGIPPPCVGANLRGKQGSSRIASPSMDRTQPRSLVLPQALERRQLHLARQLQMMPHSQHQHQHQQQPQGPVPMLRPNTMGMAITNPRMLSKMQSCIRIPPTITTLDFTAFKCCSFLTTIVLPSTITALGDGAFKGCSSLTCITLPPNITTIGDGVFWGCLSLTSLKLPPSITTIGDSVFWGCSSLTSLMLPHTLASIGYSIFNGCSSLTSVTLPPTIINIGALAFRGCSSLGSLTIPTTIRSIGNCFVYDCSSLTSLTLPSTISTIGDYFFYRCSSLTSLTLPSTITTIGNCVFEGCSSLTSLILSPNITSIGDYAFKGCSSLLSVDLPENLFTISTTAFEGCTKLSITQASSFSTIIFNKNLESILVKAGFSIGNPNDILGEQPIRQVRMRHSTTIYYNWKMWAKTYSVDGRLPAFTAAARSLKWLCMERIFTTNMPVIEEIDELTGLPLFMLAAAGPISDIESVYNLLKEYPMAMYIMRYGQHNLPTNS